GRTLVGVRGVGGGVLGGEDGALADLIPAGWKLGGVGLHVDVGGFVPANDDTGAPGRGGSGRYGERVGRGVDVEEEGTHPRRVVDGGAVDHSAVDEHHRARGSTELPGAVGGEGGHIARGGGARPDRAQLLANAPPIP